MVKPEFVVFKEDGFCADSFSLLDTMRRQKRLCDVTLKLENNASVVAHRTILAARIPYFYAMFLQDDGDNRPNLEICLENVESDAMQSLVEFAYTGSVRIDVQNMHSLMVTAHILQLNAVHVACINFMIMREMSQIRLLPAPIDTSALVQASDDCVRSLTDSLRKIITLQRSAGTTAPPSSEETHLSEMMNKIWLINPSTGCVHSFDPTDRSVQSHMEMGFDKNYKQLAVYDRKIYSFDERNDRVNMFDPATSRWTAWAPKHVQVLGDTLTLEPNIFVNGNFQKEKGYFYCAKMDTWSEATLKPVDGPYDIACDQIWVYQGGVYTIGTVTVENSKFLNVFAYNKSTQSWTPLGPTLDHRQHYGAAILNGRLYVCGGKLSNGEYTCTAVAFDMTNPNWVPIASMISDRTNGMSLVAHMGRLWAIGGCGKQVSEENRRVEVYNPDSDAWDFSAYISFGGCVKGVVLK